MGGRTGYDDCGENRDGDGVRNCSLVFDCFCMCVVGGREVRVPTYVEGVRVGVHAYLGEGVGGMCAC